MAVKRQIHTHTGMFSAAAFADQDLQITSLCICQLEAIIGAIFYLSLSILGVLLLVGALSHIAINHSQVLPLEPLGGMKD